jgi:mono/diheme cytochrome c family protein
MTFRTAVFTTLLVLGLVVRARAEDGAAVYKAQCAKCHGDTGESNTPAGKTLKVPAIKGDAKVAGASVEELVKTAKANEKHKSFITKITDEQLTGAAGEMKKLAGAK